MACITEGSKQKKHKIIKRWKVAIGSLGYYTQKYGSETMNLHLVLFFE